MPFASYYSEGSYDIVPHGFRVWLCCLIRWSWFTREGTEMQFTPDRNTNHRNGRSTRISGPGTSTTREVKNVNQNTKFPYHDYRKIKLTETMNSYDMNSRTPVLETRLQGWRQQINDICSLIQRWKNWNSLMGELWVIRGYQGRRYGLILVFQNLNIFKIFEFIFQNF